MAQSMDPRSSVVYLIDTIPTWRTSFESLSSHAAEKNAEFVAEFTRLVNQIRPKRKKTPSMTSIHTRDERPDTCPGSDSMVAPPNHVDVDPLEAGNRYLHAQIRRKRKPGTSIRSSASGPQKYRNKNQVVVYYDAHLQDQLDSMFKQIGIARNNLRKGKNALAVAKGFQLPNLRRAGQGYLSPATISLGSGDLSRTTSALTSAKRSEDSPTPGRNDEATFIQIDKELEHIQNICETAAHQFLRDGDCKTELDSIRQRLDSVLTIAIEAAESLKHLSASKQENFPHTEEDSCSNVASERHRGHVGSDTTLSTQPSFDSVQTPQHGSKDIYHAPTVSNTLEEMKARGAFFSAPVVSSGPPPLPLVTDKIEVDDASETSSIHVDISQFRMANARRLRA